MNICSYILLCPTTRPHTTGTGLSKRWSWGVEDGWLVSTTSVVTKSIKQRPDEKKISLSYPWPRALKRTLRPLGHGHSEQIGVYIILRNLQMYSSLSELHENIDKQVLPKEYGGVMPMAEMIGNNSRTIIVICFRYIISVFP